MDDIAIQRVVARRHGGQRDAEVSGAGQLGMQMENGVHLGLTNCIKVHQVSMVRKKVVIGAASTFAVRAKRAHVEIEYIAREHWVDCQGAVDVERITCCLDIPPGRATPDKKRHKNETAHSSPNRSPSAARRWNRAGLKASVADGCGNDTGHAHDQKEAENSENDAESALHLQGRERNGGNRNRNRLLAGLSGDLEAHLPGTGGHQPQAAGEERRIGGRARHGVRCRRMLRRLASDRQGSDVDAADVRTA